MPKIRKKEILKANNEYIKKSGILTRSLKNIISKKRNSKSYFTYNKFHNEDFYNNLSSPYNDNNTHLFVEKMVNPVLSIEDDFKQNSTVLHSPNEFNTEYKISKVTTANNYNKLLEPSYLQENIAFTSYNDATIETKEDLKNKKEKINIPLTFNSPCRLSLNKEDTSNYEESVTFGNETYLTANSPVAYFDFENNKWDYLGDIDQSSFRTDRNRIFDAYLCFNSIDTNSTVIKNQGIGLPINTFGFPYAGKFQGAKRHALKMSNYINFPFTIEKILVSFNGTLRSEVESSVQKSILNSLNFFLLNQRKNLNELSYTNLNVHSKKVNFYNEETQTEGELSSQYHLSAPRFTHIDNINEANESRSVDYNEKRIYSQREIISYLSLVNFSKNKNDSFEETKQKIDYDFIKKNSDFFYEQNTDIDESLNAECKYDNLNFVLSSNVKTPIYRKKMQSMSSYNVYPTSTFYNRTGNEYNTERSYKVDFEKDKNAISQIDSFGVELELGDNLAKDNPYTLLPTDELIFGVSFNPDIQTIENSNFSKDIYTLTDKVEITLIGSYYSNETPTKINKTNYNLKTSKKINFIDNKSSVDKASMSSIYLNKGAYFDENLTIYYSKTYDPSQDLQYNISNSNNTIEIFPNLYSSVISNSDWLPVKVWKPRTFISLQKNFYDNEELLLQDSNDIEVVTIDLIINDGAYGTLYGPNFNGKYFIGEELYESKKYIIDTSHSSLSGYNIKLSEYNLYDPLPSTLSDFAPYIGNEGFSYNNGISYVGTQGTPGSYILIDPRKLNLKKDLVLFFVDYAIPFPEANGVFGAMSVILKSNSRIKNFIFSKYRTFGMPFSSPFYCTQSPYYDKVERKNYYTIEKRFKNVYLESIESTLSFNSDTKSRLQIPSPFFDHVPTVYTVVTQ